MDNDTYILMGGRGVKSNPYQTLNMLALHEENKKLKEILHSITNIITGYCEACKEYEPTKNCLACNYRYIKHKLKEVENASK